MLGVAPVFAAVPVSITQQGRLIDDGEPMTGEHILEFALYDQAEDGAVLWSDQISEDLGDDGVYTVTLGTTANPIDRDVLTDSEVYLELTVGGDSFSPRMELTSVPFSMLASHAEEADYCAVAEQAQSVVPGGVTADAIESVSWAQITDVPEELEDGLMSWPDVTIDGQLTINEASDSYQPVTNQDLYVGGQIGINNESYDEGHFTIHQAGSTGPLTFSHQHASGSAARSRIDIETGAYSTVSDERLKADVRGLEPVLENILQLDAASYRMADSGPRGTRTYGFMAQQVAELFPEAVTYSEEDGYYNMAYSNFGVLAIQAIQEQQEVIDTQQQHIDDLEERIERLESAL